MIEFKEYPKINSLFMRDSKTKKFTEEFACPEFNLIKYWDVYEKIDGTNIRIFYVPKTEDKEAYLYINGRTNEAGIKGDLYHHLNNRWPIGKFVEKFENNPALLCGEGIGRGIQDNIYGEAFDFILFDVKIGPWWLQDDAIKDIADFFDIKTTQKIKMDFTWEIPEIIDYVKSHPKSLLNPEATMEGIVARPSIQLFDRKCQRIMFKLKVKDFK